MITLLIVLCGTALAWSVVAFALAILLLKWKWNLVGGFLVATFSWFPLLGLIGVFSYAAWNGTLPPRQFELEELRYVGTRGFEMFAIGGFWAGMIVATFVGLWPRRNEDGKRERWARTMPVLRIFAIGVVAIGLSWGLYFAADLRASSKLRQVREIYAKRLDTRQSTTPGQLTDTAAAQEMLLLELLQDTDPAWTVGYQELSQMTFTRPYSSTLNDVQLLTAFVPGSQKIEEMRSVAERYRGQLTSLRADVMEMYEESQFWHPLLARLVTYDALVHVYDDDLDAVLADLQLLRAMGTQVLDEGVDAPSAFAWIEFDRFLIFQAVLGKHSPAPDAIYEEMLKEFPELRPSIARNLKHELELSIVLWIDALLSRPEDEDARHDHYLTAAIERMIWSERLASTIEKTNQEIDTYYSEDAQLLYSPFDQVSFPGFWSEYEWLGGGPFLEDLYQHTNMSAHHHIRREMIRAAWEIEKYQSEQGRYPIATEFDQMLIDQSWPISLSIVPLSDRESGQVVGLLLMHHRHSVLKDQMGIYLGDSYFRLVGTLEDGHVITKDGQGRTVWGFDPNVKNFLNPTLPEYGDSTSADADGMMD